MSSDNTKLRAEFLKKAQKSVTGFVSNITEDTFPKNFAVPTGSLLIDTLLPYGGFPTGVNVHIWGPCRSFKTTICLHVAHNLIKLRPDAQILFLDLEKTIATTAEVNMHLKNFVGFTDKELADNFIYIRTTADEGFNQIEEFLKTFEYGAVIVDSIGAINTKIDYDKGYDESQKVGVSSNILTRSLDRFNQLNKNCVIMFINQVRANMQMQGGHGKPYSYSGGYKLKHNPPLSIEVRAAHKKETKEKEDYNKESQITVTIEKCKLGSENSGEVIDFSLEEPYGFNNYKEVTKLAARLGFIHRAGAGWMTVRDENGIELVKKQGDDKLAQWLAEPANEEIYLKLLNLVITNRHKLRNTTFYSGCTLSPDFYVQQHKDTYKVDEETGEVLGDYFNHDVDELI